MRSIATRLVSMCLPFVLACGSPGTEPRTPASSSVVGTVDARLTLSTTSGAEYEPNLGAPACLWEAPGCSSGVLLAGPDVAGPELQPTRIPGDGWCPDAAAGQGAHANQAITVASATGATMEEGRPIDVEVAVSSPGSLLDVLLWYAEDAFHPQWTLLPVESYVYEPTGIVRARIVPGRPGLHAVRASVGPAFDCDAQADVDDLAFVVAPPPPEWLPAPLTLEDGSAVTGSVRLALNEAMVGWPCSVEYVIERDPARAEPPQVVVGTEPPFFPAVWDSSAPPTVAGEGVTVRVVAKAHDETTGGCAPELYTGAYLGEVRLRVATPATCSPATYAQPTCTEPTVACGSDHLADGISDGSACQGAMPVDDFTGPRIERILVRSRDGQPLAPGVPARVEVDVAGIGQGGGGVAFLGVDPSTTSWELGTVPIVDPLADAARVGVDFVVGPPRDPADPLGLRYVVAHLWTYDGGEAETLAFAAPDRTPPAVALSGLAEGALVGTPVVLRAAARDAGGVAAVRFLVDGAEWGRDSEAPYEQELELGDGEHAITAVAGDATGNESESTPVWVTVDATPPDIHWNAPDPNAMLHGTVTLSGIAVDWYADPFIDPPRIELWVDDVFIGSPALQEAEPHGWPRWQLAWDTTTAVSGEHVLRAVAIDRVGQRTEAVLPVLVDQPPTLRLLHPTDGEEALDGAIRFVGEVGDDATWVDVEALVDGQVVASGRWPLAWPGGCEPPLLVATGEPAPLPVGCEVPPARLDFEWRPASLAPGTYLASARACDGAGQCVESTPARVVVPDLPPRIAITQPADGEAVSGPIELRAEATDDVEIASVEYLANGGGIGGASAAPYAVTWDPAPFSGQAVSLVARACDVAGNCAMSAPVSVTVRDVYPPRVALTAPLAGAVLFKSATLTAAVSDDVAVARVEFHADGVLIASDATAPYSATWDVRKVARGSHVLTAAAFDAAGNTASAPATVVLVK